jgi:hypothetical protein
MIPVHSTGLPESGMHGIHTSTAFAMWTGKLLRLANKKAGREQAGKQSSPIKDSDAAARGRLQLPKSAVETSCR